MAAEFSVDQKAYLDGMVVRIAEQLTQILNQRFLEERSYLTKLFREELSELKMLVERIDQRTDEDARAAGEDISQLKTRLSKLETAFEQFVATHQGH